MFSRENDYDAYVNAAADRYGVPGALLKAIIGHESQFNPNAKNLTGGDGKRGGSYGLTQMSLATARILGYQGDAAGLLDPETSIQLGAKHLGGLLRAASAGGYGMDSAVSAYNAGNSSYRPGDGPRQTINAAPPSEALHYPFTNQAYVDDVLRLWRYFLGTGASAGSAAYAAGAPKPIATPAPAELAPIVKKNSAAIAGAALLAGAAAVVAARRRGGK